MKLLVPLDGSELAATIIPTARGLTSLIPGLELHLLTVLDPDTAHGRYQRPVGGGNLGAGVPGAQGPTVRATYPNPAENRGAAIDRAGASAIDRLQHLIHDELPDNPAFCHVEWGKNPVEVILDAADKLGVDAIAMASHGRSGVSHMLAGSVTEGVMRRSHRPVLVMGPGTRSGERQRPAANV